MIKLTKTDKLILDSYASMMEGLAKYLGSAYEISLHSLEDYNHSVVKIMNGYHSGRSVGAPLTDLAINMLKRINDGGLSEKDSYTTYNAVTQTGERLKSSTLPIIGENDRVIGMLCINFYLDTPLSEILGAFEDRSETVVRKEHFSSDMQETIKQAVAEARMQVMNNSDIPTTNKHKEVIRILKSRGLFKIKDSVQTVARALDISKSTVYMHLRSLSDEEK